MEFDIEKIIEDSIMNELNELSNNIANCYEELMLSMLEQYGIDRNDLSKENISRVEIVTTGFFPSKHVFVDGCYAFTIEEIAQIAQKWEKESVFTAKVGYIVKVHEHMKGQRVR